MTCLLNASEKKSMVLNPLLAHEQQQGFQLMRFLVEEC